MFQKLEIIRMAEAMASHAGARQGVVARNIANADTPGYKAQDLPDFAQTYRVGNEGAMLATRTGHLTQTPASTPLIARVGTGSSSPNGNSVSLEGEMVNAVEVRQQHDLALAIYRNATDILRASLGRGR